MAASVAAYFEATTNQLNVYLGVHIDPLPYIMVGSIGLVGFVAGIFSLKSNQ